MRESVIDVFPGDLKDSPTSLSLRVLNTSLLGWIYGLSKDEMSVNLRLDPLWSDALDIGRTPRETPSSEPKLVVEGSVLNADMSAVLGNVLFAPGREGTSSIVLPPRDDGAYW